GELASAKATLAAARTRLERPVHLRVDLATAEAEAAKAETELANLPFTLRAGQARLQFARSDWEGKSVRGPSTPQIAVDRARSELDAAGAAVEEVQSRQKLLTVEVAALREKREALRQRLQLKTEEVRQAAEAEAAVQTAQARLKQAEVTHDAA